MSAYAEWKAGMITDAEYASICRQEYYESMRDCNEDEDEEEVFEDDDIDEW